MATGALTVFLPEIESLRSRGKINVGDALTVLESIIARGQLIADALAAYESKKAKRVAVPFSEVTTTVQAIEEWIATYSDDLDYPTGLFSALRDAAQGLFSLASLRRAFASQVTPAAGATNVFVPGPAPLVAYRIRSGDTLERIALTALGSIERVWEILALNALDYPYLVTDRGLAHDEFAAGEFAEGEFATEGSGWPDRVGVGQGVRVPGETLWLPSDARVPGGDENANRDVELWGRDMALPGGFVSFGADGELVTVEGAENITQALRQRVGTMRGDLVFHPTYGMTQALTVGVEGTRSNVILSGLEVARTVVQDPRVVRVRNLGILFDDTVNTAGMDVELIGGAGRGLPLNLVIPEALAAT